MAILMMKQKNKKKTKKVNMNKSVGGEMRSVGKKKRTGLEKKRRVYRREDERSEA